MRLRWPRSTLSPHSDGRRPDGVASRGKNRTTRSWPAATSWVESGENAMTTIRSPSQSRRMGGSAGRSRRQRAISSENLPDSATSAFVLEKTIVSVRMGPFFLRTREGGSRSESTSHRSPCLFQSRMPSSDEATPRKVPSGEKP